MKRVKGEGLGDGEGGVGLGWGKGLLPYYVRANKRLFSALFPILFVTGQLTAVRPEITGRLLHLTRQGG